MDYSDWSMDTALIGLAGSSKESNRIIDLIRQSVRASESCEGMGEPLSSISVLGMESKITFTESREFGTCSGPNGTELHWETPRDREMDLMSSSGIQMSRNLNGSLRLDQTTEISE